MPSPLQSHGSVEHSLGGWGDAVTALVAPATRLAALGPDQCPTVMSNHDRFANWFELLTRPLWGLAPMAAGGQIAATPWSELRAGLTAAVDPDHPWYIGAPSGQLLVEAGAVGYGLAVAPEQLWEPLTPRQRDRLATWLRGAHAGKVADTNWHFFPVLVGMGLDRVGVDHDRDITAAHLDRVADFALSGGCYEDGPGGRVDYYNPFAFHWYGLLVAALRGDDRFVAAATRFATDFTAWFAADGAAVPYGRSLGYRFAQGALWGALAVADVPAVPWPTARGLAQRHLDWWWRQPILDTAGCLSVGYRYPNDAVAEQYVTAGSPYWGLKFFAPLAQSGDHPFWTCDPQPPVRDRVEVTGQPGARAVLARDEDGDVVRLNGQAWHPWARNGQASYAKFAYSSLAGFSVSAAGPGPEFAVPDGSLFLSEDGRHWRGREDSDEGFVDGDTVTIEWTPWPDVRVRTRLVAVPPWHARVHDIVTERELHTTEGGWCAPLAGHSRGSTETGAWVSAGEVHSAIADVAGGRTATIIEPMPGTHLLWPSTVLPVLTGRLQAGRHTLACAVYLGRRHAEPTPPNVLVRRLAVGAR